MLQMPRSGWWYYRPHRKDYDPSGVDIFLWFPRSCVVTRLVRSCGYSSQEPPPSAFPRWSGTTIKLAAHRNVGEGFSPRPDTYRSLKAAPTGLNLMAVTLERGNEEKPRRASETGGGPALSAPRPDRPPVSRRSAPGLACLTPELGRNGSQCRSTGSRAGSRDGTRNGSASRS